MAGLNLGSIARLLALLLLIRGLALDSGGLGLEPWCKELRLVHLALKIADYACRRDVLGLVHGYKALVEPDLTV